jgi:hypothetical protein
VQVKADAAGDIGFELSYGSFDLMIQAALASSYSTALDLTDTDISASSADNSINSAGAGFSNVVDGQWVKVSGFVTTANNGIFKVVTATTSKLILLTTLVTEAASASVTVKAQMARNGTETHSFTIQKSLGDATTETFFNFTGARIGSMSLDFQTGQILTGSFGVMALGMVTSEAQFSGATVLQAPSATPMNSVSNLSNVYLDGAISTAQFSTLSFQLNNALRARDAIGSLSHIDIALGTISLSGGINIYFEDRSLYEKYRLAQSLALSFAVTDIDGDTYVFTLPKIKFETGEVVSGGLDTDVMFNATWRAIVDEVTDCMVQIDKL